MNTRGNFLRFCTAVTDDARRIADVRAKLSANEPIIVATSYPNMAARELSQRGIVPILRSQNIQNGGIEALPNQYRTVDIIFELVQSGDTLKDNRLKILDDGIVYVDLMKVERRSELNLSYNGGQDGIIY